MSPRLLRRTPLLVPLLLTALAGCTDTDTTAPRFAPKPQLAQGAGGVWTVNSLADPGGGGCDDTECTLREAIGSAGPGHQVVVASGLQGTITLTAGEIVINRNVSVDGGGRIAVNAQETTRIFHVVGSDIATPIVVTVAGLSLEHGREGLGDGGGILVEVANLTLRDVHLRWNEANRGGGMFAAATAAVTISSSSFESSYGSAGGALYNLGAVTLVGSSVILSATQFKSGQIANHGTLSVIASMIGAAFEPGIVNHPGATATIMRTTLSGNSVVAEDPGLGAAIHNLGTVVMRSSTISANASPTGVGGLYNAGSMTVSNSIVAGNNGNPECGGPSPVMSLGYNLTSAGGGCAFSAVGDQQVPLPVIFTNVLVGGLEDNGGLTRTLALIPGGLAVDRGSCPGETMDQRGAPRPVDNPSVSNAADGCDIGAFELQLTSAEQVTALTVSVSSLGLASGTANSLRTKLTAALSAIEAGDIAGACTSLTGFTNEVRALVGKKMSATDASALTAKADALKSSLGCP